MHGDGQPVDGADEIPTVVIAGLVLLQASLAKFGEKARKTIGDVGALWFVSGQEDQQVGIATPQPRYEASCAQDHLCVRCPRELARGGLRVFCLSGQIGPFQR